MVVDLRESQSSGCDSDAMPPAEPRDGQSNACDSGGIPPSVAMQSIMRDSDAMPPPTQGGTIYGSVTKKTVSRVRLCPYGKSLAGTCVSALPPSVPTQGQSSEMRRCRIRFKQRVVKKAATDRSALPPSMGTMDMDALPPTMQDQQQGQGVASSVQCAKKGSNRRKRAPIWKCPEAKCPFQCEPPLLYQKKCVHIAAWHAVEAKDEKKKWRIRPPKYVVQDLGEDQVPDWKCPHCSQGMLGEVGTAEGRYARLRHWKARHKDMERKSMLLDIKTWAVTRPAQIKTRNKAVARRLLNAKQSLHSVTTIMWDAGEKDRKSRSWTACSACTRVAKSTKQLDTMPCRTIVAGTMQWRLRNKHVMRLKARRSTVVDPLRARCLDNVIGFLGACLNNSAPQRDRHESINIECVRIRIRKLLVTMRACKNCRKAARSSRMLQISACRPIEFKALGWSKRERWIAWIQRVIQQKRYRTKQQAQRLLDIMSGGMTAVPVQIDRCKQPCRRCNAGLGNVQRKSGETANNGCCLQTGHTEQKQFLHICGWCWTTIGFVKASDDQQLQLQLQEASVHPASGYNSGITAPRDGAKRSLS